MIREFRHLKLMKRHGQGNVKDSLVSMSRGDLATICPACPIPNVNLPENWEDVDLASKSVIFPPVQVARANKHSSHLRFLYVLIVALDANFRLKNLMCSSLKKDPRLHTGFAYFPEDAPYQKHILKYATQKDVRHYLKFHSLY